MAQGGWDVGTWDSALWDSLPITGNAATGSPGSVGVDARTVALTGNGATGATGTVTPSDTIATTGNSATGAVGTPLAAISFALTGNAATGATGNITPSALFALTGNAATGSAGNVIPALSIGLNGVQATGAVGTEGEGVTVALTGASATGQVGTVTRGETSIGLNGVQASGAVGNVIFVPPPIIVIDDTHDGDYIKKRQKLFDEEIQRVARKRQDIVAAYERIVEGKPEVAKELVFGFEVKVKNKNNKQQKTMPSIDFDKFIKDLDRVERLWNEYLEIEDEDLLVLL